MTSPEDVASHTRDYQTLLEHHRRDPDDELTWRQLTQAKAKMEQAWLEYSYGRSTS